MRSDKDQGLVERWSLDAGGFLGEDGRMVKDPEGDYVAYTDHIAASEREAKLREELEAKSERIAGLQAQRARSDETIATLQAALATARGDALEGAAKVADAVEEQQEIDHGAANTGGASASAAAIRALLSKEPDNAR